MSFKNIWSHHILKGCCNFALYSGDRTRTHFGLPLCWCSVIRGPLRAPGGTVNCYVYSDVCVVITNKLSQKEVIPICILDVPSVKTPSVPGCIAFLTALRRLWGYFLEISYSYLLSLHFPIWKLPTTVFCHFISQCGSNPQLPSVTSFPNLEVTHIYLVPLRFHI